MKYELLILLAIAVFLVLRLRSVLGTREGFEKPPEANRPEAPARDFQVIEGGPDTDITDHVPEDSPMVETISSIKRVDPEFRLSDFLSGARAAYEMILMGFERGEIDDIRPYLSEEVAETFDEVVASRTEQGLTIHADFAGIREMKLQDVQLDADTQVADLTVQFTAELFSEVRNADGDVVEGDAKQVKRQRDIWTFSKDMRSSDPNWRLVATDQ